MSRQTINGNCIVRRQTRPVRRRLATISASIAIACNRIPSGAPTAWVNSVLSRTVESESVTTMLPFRSRAKIVKKISVPSSGSVSR
jgi:hypothetical protein